MAPTPRLSGINSPTNLKDNVSQEITQNLQALANKKQVKSRNRINKLNEIHNNTTGMRCVGEISSRQGNRSELK